MEILNCFSVINALQTRVNITLFEMPTLEKVCCPFKSPAADPAYLNHTTDSGDNILRKK